MKLVVGLGNPEKQYQNTRHNTGSMALEWVAATHQAQWQTKPKLHAKQAQIELNGEPALLITLATNYNNSGLSVRKVKDFYNIDNNDIVVIHDELALPFGTIRVREKGSDAGNNGIKNINTHIGENYTRIRIGISHEDKKQSDMDFVLSNFTREEAALLPEIFMLTESVINDFLNNTLEPISHTL